MAERSKSEELALAGFYEAMEKSNTITDDILARLLDDSEDSEGFDFESDADDVEERPWKLSHVNFGKSTVKRGHNEAMKGKYFHNVSIVRPGGESTVPLPKKDNSYLPKLFEGWVVSPSHNVGRGSKKVRNIPSSAYSRSSH
jgi:hypothetical protein